MTDLMQKAQRALKSAKLLLDADDLDGACNRAYYAMFDAARAALFTLHPSINPETVRSHNGLISAFSLHLVKTGQVPVEQGRALNKVEEMRLIADYRGDSVKPEQAARAVEQAESFVDMIKGLLSDHT